MSPASPSAADIERALRSLVAERLRIDPADVPMDVPIIGELGLESVDVMQLLLRVEDLFPHFCLSDSAGPDPRTLRDLVEGIDRAGRAT
jgi:acyl carrier protein